MAENPAAKIMKLVDQVAAGALAGDPDAINAALEEGKSLTEDGGSIINCAGELGLTALSRVVMHVNPHAAIRLLFAAGADVNTRNTIGWTTLMWAACCLQVDKNVIIRLLEAGADITALNDDKTALKIAISTGFKNMDNLLEELEALDAYELKKIDRTTLSITTAEGRKNIAALLKTTEKLAGSGSKLANLTDLVRRRMGAIVVLEATEGLVHDISQRRDITQIKGHLENGAVASAMGANGLPLIIEACNHGLPDVVKLLLRAGANIGAQNTNGETAVQIARKAGHNDIAEAIIEEAGTRALRQPPALTGGDRSTFTCELSSEYPRGIRAALGCNCM